MPSPATICSLDPGGTSGYRILSHMQTLMDFMAGGGGARHIPLGSLVEQVQFLEAKDALLFMLSPL